MATKRNSKSIYFGKTLRELCDLLISSKTEENDEIIENEIEKIINNENVSELKPLFDAPGQFYNVVGLRVLSEATTADISQAYDFVDQLFERKNLTLERLTVSLILDYGFFRHVQITELRNLLNLLICPCGRTFEYG